jgi:hypothetical protein
MQQRQTKRSLFVVGVAMIAAILTIDASLQRVTAASPFAGMRGAWSGDGVLTLLGGARERVQCRATYALGDELRVTQDLRCASSSYKFEVRGDVTNQNGTISGTWQETTRGLFGNLVGRMRGSQIDARIEGPTFAALLTLVTRGNQQTVSIRSPGSQVEEVLIRLRRR